MMKVITQHGFVGTEAFRFYPGKKPTGTKRRIGSRLMMSSALYIYTRKQDTFGIVRRRIGVSFGEAL